MYLATGNTLPKDVPTILQASSTMCLLESNSMPLATPSKMAKRYFEIGMANLIFKDSETFLILLCLVDDTSILQFITLSIGVNP